MSLPLPMKKVIRTPQAPAPVGPYNQAISAQGLLFVAGQIPLDPQSGAMVGVGDVAKQTEQVMANLGAVLQEAGVGWAQVVKTTVFLKNMEDFGAMNEVYAQHFQEQSAPARACVEVARLPKDALVEIDCIALLGT
ncbi:MAG: RidA family protein [Cyanobacteriota bacterium]